MGSSNPSIQFGIRWVHPDGRIYSHGMISMAEFSDSNQYNYDGIIQNVYAAMVIPVVCYASTERTVTVRLTRNHSGVGAWLGRPIVLPIACSWFIQQ
ncbi:MAG: hypothetical protein A2Z16_11655 [Chloroflexi bacterium RBG_16_54_18]|nr:MAG: hypothetical protein A2Z16_11655 [Chloroflexi bacterium RBG_16_54_18]